ncbi:MAG: ATP-binding cassette domain-containing protein [Bacteroidetes bacterium]|jgi:Fe-S cluster assembly ATP-binding protein|nr:ATP-binding cassette domain-containing protein [Phycisphaerae bacterium]NBC18366.1 ATP-binding cassette domain-containing protein [Bacteroidota bacterium]
MFSETTSGNETVLLSIEDLCYAPGGTTILDGLSLDLWGGYTHAICGPNGAGKSTLAYTIMGLGAYRDVTGEIRLDGESIVDEPIDERARRGITLGWQEPARFEGLSIEQFILAGARGRDVDVEDVMQKAGLSPLRYNGRAVDKTLSGGERKKVELASLLAMQPRLVILDEPDSGIDVDSLKRIREAIDILKRDGGSTVLLITHSDEVLSWAEHAFLMCCGKIVDKGVVDRIQPYFENRCIPCRHKNRPNLDEM